MATERKDLKAEYLISAPEYIQYICTALDHKSGDLAGSSEEKN
jgi:hypothetical protein